MTTPPYPIPIPVKTTLRCQFVLPGKRYNCRSVGKYVMDQDGRRYCGRHYDLRWKYLNPIVGQQHEWHFHVNHLNGEADRYECCKRCMMIRVYEGLPQMPCKGKMDRITLR